mmetsp:Transcript_3338/g.9447  ORF Transcript_3338/g.9447 Transcript_3338/m.9447 type:complete len:384 (+) Transcript_3338:627-1778(+)
MNFPATCTGASGSGLPQQGETTEMLSVTLGMRFGQGVALTGTCTEALSSDTKLSGQFTASQKVRTETGSSESAARPSRSMGKATHVASNEAAAILVSSASVTSTKTRRGGPSDATTPVPKRKPALSTLIPVFRSSRTASSSRANVKPRGRSSAVMISPASSRRKKSAKLLARSADAASCLTASAINWCTVLLAWKITGDCINALAPMLRSKGFRRLSRAASSSSASSFKGAVIANKSSTKSHLFVSAAVRIKGFLPDTRSTGCPASTMAATMRPRSPEPFLLSHAAHSSSVYGRPHQPHVARRSFRHSLTMLSSLPHRKLNSSASCGHGTLFLSRVSTSSHWQSLINCDMTLSPMDRAAWACCGVQLLASGRSNAFEGSPPSG